MGGGGRRVISYVGFRSRGLGSGEYDRCSLGRGRRGIRSFRRSFFIGIIRLIYGVRFFGRYYYGFSGGLRVESYERLFFKSFTSRVFGVIEFSY